jgi:hypothetical protein
VAGLGVLPVYQVKKKQENTDLENLFLPFIDLKLGISRFFKKNKKI